MVTIGFTFKIEKEIYKMFKKQLIESEEKMSEQFRNFILINLESDLDITNPNFNSEYLSNDEIEYLIKTLEERDEKDKSRLVSETKIRG